MENTSDDMVRIEDCGCVVDVRGWVVARCRWCNMTDRAADYGQAAGYAKMSAANLVGWHRMHALAAAAGYGVCWRVLDTVARTGRRIAVWMNA